MKSAQTLILEPGRTAKNYWRDLFHYRELFLILAWRDVIVRYKQTAAGAAWALIQPMMSILIMTLIFGGLAGLPSEHNAPYAIMVCAATLPWQFFANALSLSSQSVVSNASLISKIYFPRMIVPASSIVVSLVDFLVACSILAGLMVWYHFPPTWRLLVLPALVLLAVAAALGPGLILTALTVRYRDFRMIIPFIVQFGLYVCPVAYSSHYLHDKLVHKLGPAVGEKLFLVYSLNPMVGVIDGFRWAILGGTSATIQTTPGVEGVIATLQGATTTLQSTTATLQGATGTLQGMATPLQGAVAALQNAAATLQSASAPPASATTFYWPSFAMSVVLTVILLIIGIYYFRKTERAFADVI